MKQFKFIILFGFLLMIARQKSFSQDLTGFHFTCEKTNYVNKDTVIFWFQPHVFYIKEIRYIKTRDTFWSSEKIFNYTIDTSRCNEYIFTYNFKRTYSTKEFPIVRTLYGELQYHRKYKTLTLIYYKAGQGKKEIGRQYSYTIKKTESEEKTE